MRETISINQDWKFLKGEDTSSHLGGYNDILWEEVNLPHSVDITPLISSGGRNYQGICRYRKRFTLSPKDHEEKILLEFEGAMQILEVWINDHKLQTHYCGYTPAIYDVTPYISFTEENFIAVRLDNSDCNSVPPGKSQGRLDFTYEGGLYRNVLIHRLPAVHVTNAVEENIIAGGGIFVTYDDVLEQTAKVNIKTHIRNITNKNQNLTLQQTIISQDGKCVSYSQMSIKLDKGSAEHFNSSLEVSNPKLWHPNHPYLYELETTILEGKKVLDKLNINIGIRTFDFTVDNGFIINGQKLKMSGANYHTTFGQVGNAMSDNLLRRDARKLREAGMINIRSHYPFPNSFTDECDKLGMTLIISNPGWQYFEEGIFIERAYQNIRDIIRWLRNHPSIIIWEAILNESRSMTAEFQKRVHEIVHEEIPSGPCFTGSDSGFSDISYKAYDPRMFDPELVEKYPEILEEAKKINKNKPRWVREYGDFPDNFTDQNTVWRVPRGWGEDLMIKQVRRMIWTKQDEWLENYIGCYNDESLCGFGMWPGIEHNRGYHMNPCYGGFLDLQRIPKYSFYFFKSQQAPDINIDNVNCGPMIFIANSWSELSPDDITIYSNCERVRLYHNDIFIEEREPDDVAIQYPPFTFKNNFYFGRPRSGIRVEGIIGGKVVAEDSRFSPGVTTKLHLVVDTMGIGLVADGSDLIFIRCEAHDDRGSVVPLTFDAHEIVFNVSGEAKIIGDSEKYTELGINGVLLQSTKKAGKITVTVHQKLTQRNENKPVEAGKLEIFSQDII